MQCDNWSAMHPARVWLCGHYALWTLNRKCLAGVISHSWGLQAVDASSALPYVIERFFPGNTRIWITIPCKKIKTLIFFFLKKKSSQYWFRWNHKVDELIIMLMYMFLIHYRSKYYIRQRFRDRRIQFLCESLFLWFAITNFRHLCQTNGITTATKTTYSI